MSGRTTAKAVHVTRAPQVTKAVMLALGIALSAGALDAQRLRLSSGSGGGERQPVLDAGGTVVAYGAMVAGSREVFTVGIDGGTPVQHTSGAEVVFGFGTFDSWSSLSIAADGTRITYWNAAGVHVLDTVAGTDTVVAGASLLPYPQISPAGDLVVYQDSVGGDLEVFLVPAQGGTPVQLTSASGAGRRLPSFGPKLQGVDQVLFQKPQNGDQEVFVTDPSGVGPTQLTTGSGPGNRYARYLIDGPGHVVYEPVVQSAKEVAVHDLATGVSTLLTTQNLGGDRLCAPSADREVLFQQPVQPDLEVCRVDLDAPAAAVVVLTAGSGGGLRRPATDRRGRVVVWQAVEQGRLEVFRERLAHAVDVVSYGQAGQPSQGTLQVLVEGWRRDQTLGLRTAFTSGAAAFVIGAQRQLPGIALPGAPGNSIWVVPAASVTLPISAGGEARFTFPLGAIPQGVVHFQWAVLDPPANALGVVTTEGTTITFR